MLYRLLASILSLWECVLILYLTSEVINPQPDNLLWKMAITNRVASWSGVEPR